MPDGKTARNVSKDSRRRSATTGRRRRFYAKKLWRRRKWPEGWKNRRRELSDLPQDGLGHDERSVEKRSTEQDRVRSWTCITSSHGNSEEQYQRSPRGGAQGTSTASRVPATHMQQALQQQVCALTGAIQQLAETQQVATAWTSEETRRKTSQG